MHGLETLARLNAEAESKARAAALPERIVILFEDARTGATLTSYCATLHERANGRPVYRAHGSMARYDGDSLERDVRWAEGR